MSQRADVIRKVGKLVTQRFGGNYKAAFDAYDEDQDGHIDTDELKRILEHAGVGNKVTRAAYVRAVIAELDTNNDGEIAWTEFDKVFNGE